MSRVETIKKYAVLDDEWLPGGVELSPTMKLRRVQIAVTYAVSIESLYDDLSSRVGCGIPGLPPAVATVLNGTGLSY